jgi:hypothetical protein
MNLKIVAAASAVALFALSYLPAPALAIMGLKEAIRTSDAEALGRHVDFASLRTSLKEQVTATMLTNPEKKGNVFAFALGPMMVNSFVDNWITPSTLANLIRSRRSGATETSDSAPNFGLSDMYMRGLSEVRVIPKATAPDEQIQVVFVNSGIWNWRLTDIRLPARALEDRIRDPEAAA